MRFKVFLLILGSFFLSSCGSHSSWFGEEPAKPPQLKVNYMQNDSETIQCFKIIDIQYAKFLDGTLSPDGFVKIIDCSEILILKGASHIELKTKDTFTTEEIEAILKSGVLAESQAIERWVKRFSALAKVLQGSETDAITMSDIAELFGRIRQTAPDLSKLSALMAAQNKVSSKESPEFWQLRQKIFIKLFDIARTMVKDNEAPLVREILLHQREYFELGIGQETWDRFIETAFVVNKTIFGRSGDKIEPQDIPSILNILDMTFQKVFDVYGVYAAKVWTSKEWAFMIKRYEEVLVKFLDAFSENKAQEIKAHDLAKILSLVHVGTQEEADTFVSALVDLKTNILKSPGSSFLRQDVKELRQFLHQAIEKAREESQLKLSDVLLPFVDYVIQMHDVNQDGKLSVSSPQTSPKEEMAPQELSALIHTIQKIGVGFKKLMGESNFLNSVSDMEADTLGKIIIAISDTLFVHSDQDGKLGREEMMEILSFMTEIDQLASILYWSDSLNSAHWIKSMYLNVEFRKYFPRIRPAFLNSGDFKEYVKQYLSLFHKEESHPVTVGELKVILGHMKFVEQLFLKFDTNQDHQLSQDEIKKVYALFDALMKDVIAHLTASGQGASFLDTHWFWVWWEIGSEADVREAVVVYAFTEGKIPSKISQVISGSSKTTATRQDVMKLFLEILTYLK